MPRKLRRAKLRVSDDREAMAWRMLFGHGHDYLHELRALGINTDEQARAAARKAWRKFGRQFLAGWDANAMGRKPWALETFGEP